MIWTDGFKKLISKVKEGSFARNVLKVTFGTVVAQLLTLCAIPLLTGVYSVESFGILGVYIAFSGVARVVFSCRYDFAIPTAKGASEASALLWLNVLLSAFFCALSYGVMYSFSITYIEKFGEVKYFIPLMFFISSVDNILSLWVNRVKSFGLFSVSRIVRAASIAVSQLLIGMFFDVHGGLLYGLLIGEGVAVLFIVYFLHCSSKKIKATSVRRILVVAKKHRDNPIYLLPGHALNMGVSQLPIIIIEAVYGAAAAGLLYMAQKVVSIPGQLIGSAAFRVYFSEASRRYNLNGTCYILAKKTILAILLITLILFAIIDIVSYNFIGQLLGEQWDEARLTILLYSVIELLPTVFYPISGIWFITNNQKTNFKYQLLRSALVGIGLIVGVSIGGYYNTLICYGVFRTVAFAIFLNKCLTLSKGSYAK